MELFDGVWENACKRRKGFERGEEGGSGLRVKINNQGKVGGQISCNRQRGVGRRLGDSACIADCPHRKVSELIRLFFRAVIHTSNYLTPCSPVS